MEVGGKQRGVTFARSHEAVYMEWAPLFLKGRPPSGFCGARAASCPWLS